MKRILSLILAICLILTLAPVVIYADEPTFEEGILIGEYVFNEEFANTEKTAMAAIKKGFNKSIAPTAGIHIVAGVTALLLLAFTTGVVQCFAITFGIGIAVSLIVTLGFTRMYSALILPLVDDKEKFLRFKRAQVVEEGEVE